MVTTRLDELGQPAILHCLLLVRFGYPDRVYLPLFALSLRIYS